MANARGVRELRKQQSKVSKVEEEEDDDDDDSDDNMRPSVSARRAVFSDSEQAGEPCMILAWQDWVYSLLRSIKFDTFIGCCIVLNSAMVGFEQQSRIESRPADDPEMRFISVMEHIFLSIYVVELAMRFFSLGPMCISDHWVKFDVILVIIGVVNTWIMPALVVEGDRPGHALMVLRTGRLLRLARTVRLLVKFQVLWMLVRGLLTSAGTMLYTLGLLIVILYLFSCVGFEMITCSSFRLEDPEFDSIVSEWFPDLVSIMLTLLQFVCLDSVASIYRPLILEQWILLPYFVCIILVVPIGLMNLVTAVIVNGAIERADQEKDAMVMHEERKKKKGVRELERIFNSLDEDDSGYIDMEEIMQITEADRLALSKLTNCTEPEEIFKAFDVDNTGKVNISELIKGIWQVAISKVPLEMKRMEIQISRMYQEQQNLQHEQAQFRDQMVAFKHEALSMLHGVGNSLMSHDPHRGSRPKVVVPNDLPEAEAKPPNLRLPSDPPEAEVKLDKTTGGSEISEAKRVDDKYAPASHRVVAKLEETSVNVRPEAKLIDGTLTAARPGAEHTSSSVLMDGDLARSFVLLRDIAAATELHVQRLQSTTLADIAVATELHLQRLQSIQHQVFHLRRDVGPSTDRPLSASCIRSSQNSKDDDNTGTQTLEFDVGGGEMPLELPVATSRIHGLSRVM